MSLTAIFFGGQLADRYFSQEKFLAFSLLVSGVALLGLTFAKDFWPFFGLTMLYSFFYVPTLSITNAIAFANLQDSQKEFGFVRVGGTLGWIAAAWPFVFLPITNLFTIAGIAALVTAAYCLVLPSTPPAKHEGSAFAPFKAFKLLSVPTILVLFIVTFIDSLVHNCYFITSGPFYEKKGLPENWISTAMSIGQIAEIATMAAPGLLPQASRLASDHDHRRPRPCHPVRDLCAGRLRRWSDGLGLIVLSNIVHGFAYAFFFATVYIFVDENFPKDVRTTRRACSTC